MSQKLILPVATLSYPNLFEPRGYDGSEPKYSAALVMEPAGLTALKNAIVAVAKERFGDKTRTILQGNPPIHNEEQALLKGYPEGTVFINAKSTRAPGIVSRYADPKTGKPTIITEDMATEPEGSFEMYPGVQVKAYVSVYAYDRNGNRGIAFGLEGLQRWDEGDRLDGRIAASDLFEGEMPEEAAYLEDLMDEGEEEDAMDDDPIAAIL